MEKNNKINLGKVNELVKSSHKLIRVLYFVILIIGIYAITLILEKCHILDILVKLFNILAPLFIGIVIAWLLEPIVTWFSKKNIKRIFGALITYVIFIGMVVIFFVFFIPTIASQVNDFLKTIPSIIDNIKNWFDNLFINFGIGDNTKTEIFNKISDFSLSLTTNIPELGINLIKDFISGITSFVLGLVIGFYMLVSFDNITDTVVDLIPSKKISQVTDLMYQINTSLRHYIQGLLLVAFFVFLSSSLGFIVSGLDAPLLFGLICGITDLIPFIGPFIGGIFAVVVGFSLSPTTGILVLITVIAVQCIENYILQPIIMSKSMKLNPVTIIIGLLIFGSIFGIIGMILATPIIASLKIIGIYFEKKYHILGLYN